MIMKGVSPGAAMVFLMTGPATNMATITTLWKLLGRRSALIYLAVLVVSAISAGLVMDYIVQSLPAASHHMDHGWMMPELINTLCAIMLIILLVTVSINGKREKSHR